MKRISIVTAIHNQLIYNRLFFHSLKQTTHYPFDLIIINNASNDGSAEFFKEQGALVLDNDVNYCYSCSQNIGLKHVRTDYVAFLNNDILLSKDWDLKLIQNMGKYGLDIVSPRGIENMETEQDQKRMMIRWRWINSLQRLRAILNLKYSETDLVNMVDFMYGGFDRYVRKSAVAFHNFLYPGILGNSVFCRTDVFKKIGLWDKFAADPDINLELRMTKAQLTGKNVKMVMIVGDVFVHHFIRATFRGVRKPCGCVHPRKDVPERFHSKDLRYFKRPRISLIIAVYEKPEFLERILITLKQQTFSDFEIVISDDGSGPSIGNLVRKYDSAFKYPIQHIRHENKGFRKTVIANKAVLASRSNYLCFIDGDCFLHPKFLENHWRFKALNTVLSGRRVMLTKEATSRLTSEFVQKQGFLDLKYIFSSSERKSWKHAFCSESITWIEGLFKKKYWIFGSNFSMYKGNFYQLNGYDESIIGRGLEDVNLSSRAVLKGFKIRTVTRAAVQYHQFHSSAPVPHDEKKTRLFTHPKDFWAVKGIRKGPQ